MPLLSDTPENDKLVEILSDELAYARGQTQDGPRFGLMGIAAQTLPIYLFDTPSLQELADVATDGSCVLIRAQAYRSAHLEESQNPGFAIGSLALVLAGAAQACAIAMGEALDDPISEALSAAPPGLGAPVLALRSVTVETLPKVELARRVAEAGHARASEVIEQAGSPERSEALRESLVAFFNAKNGQGPQADFMKRLRETGVRLGAIAERDSSFYASGLAASKEPAMALVERACLVGQARSQARKIDDSIGPGSPRPAHRV